MLGKIIRVVHNVDLLPSPIDGDMLIDAIWTNGGIFVKFFEDKLLLSNRRVIFIPNERLLFVEKELTEDKE